MKYKSSLISDGRGKLGGQVYTGGVIRNRVTPRQPRTDAQQAGRARFGVTAGQWRQLTQDQRDGWDRLAAQYTLHDVYGQPYAPTGFQLFMQVNVYAVQLYQPFQADAAPTPPVVEQGTFVGGYAYPGDPGGGMYPGTAQVDYGSLIAFYSNPLVSTWSLTYLTDMYSAGVSRPKPAWFKLASISSEYGGGLQENIANQPYQPGWQCPPLVAGTRVAIKLLPVALPGYPGQTAIFSTVVRPWVPYDQRNP